MLKPLNKMEECLYVTHKHQPICFKSSLDYYDTQDDVNAVSIIVILCYLGKNNKGKSVFSTDIHFRNILNFI